MLFPSPSREAAPSVADAFLARCGALPPAKFYKPNIAEQIAAGIDPSVAARVGLGGGFGNREGERGIAVSFS